MSGVKQFVSFYCDHKLYGIDIHLINDVSPNSSNIMPVPLSDPHVRGLVNIRGQVILVLDISVILGNKESPLTPQSHIVILKNRTALSRVRGLDKDIDIFSFSDKPIGFLVDRIGDVVSVNEMEIEATTKYIEKENLRYISGVIKIEDQILILLFPSRMLSHGKKNDL